MIEIMDDAGLPVGRDKMSLLYFNMHWHQLLDLFVKTSEHGNKRLVIVKQCFCWVLKISGYFEIFRQSMMPNL